MGEKDYKASYLLLNMVKVKEIMKTEVVSADPETNAVQLCRMMNNNQFGSVVIKEFDEGEPLGIVTWSAIVTLIAKGGNPYQTKTKKQF